ncbi:MAG: sugar kinase, partial [Candidatus Hodarchaeales archaeon]
LFFSVREPWASKISGSNLIFGRIDENDVLEIEAHMPDSGVIFSDGIESDYINFTSGTIAKIGIAEKKAYILTKN